MNKIPAPTAQATRRRSSRLRLLDKRETTQQSNYQRPVTPTMPSTSLSDLPTELIVQVFYSVVGFSTAATLSSLSHRLFSIWKRISTSLCTILLSRVIDCFNQARILVEAQWRYAQDQNSFDANEAAIERTKLFFANEDIACNALRRYEYPLFDEEILDGRDMTVAERTSFVKAWYRTIAMVTLGSDFEPLPYQILVSMDLLQFLQLMEAISWLGCFQDEHEKLRPYMSSFIAERSISIY